MLESSYEQHIEGFLCTFLSEHRAVRWRAILNKKPKHWKKVSAWDLWDNRYTSTKHCIEWNHSLKELLASSLFMPYQKKQCVVIHCGHAEGKIETLSLLDALTGENALFEGIISIVPYKLALVVNHDGDICICQKQT
ncbi:hypothetical protein [Candidatus Albibeggiatoa sp. nov. BB20]|uniref:hypothetical protein n=1 Tax=Candidatus Albibeggiatoa sp. nov. BB20 TaxID=3162723 RepID=UPI0033656546